MEDSATFLTTSGEAETETGGVEGGEAFAQSGNFSNNSGSSTATTIDLRITVESSSDADHHRSPRMPLLSSPPLNRSRSRSMSPSKVSSTSELVPLSSPSLLRSATKYDKIFRDR